MDALFTLYTIYSGVWSASDKTAVYPLHYIFMPTIYWIIYKYFIQLFTYVILYINIILLKLQFQVLL